MKRTLCLNFSTWLHINTLLNLQFKKVVNFSRGLIIVTEKPCIPMMISTENVLCPIDPIVPGGHFPIPYPVSDFLSKISVETSNVVFFPSFPFQYHKLLVLP